MTLFVSAIIQSFRGHCFQRKRKCTLIPRSDDWKVLELSIFDLNIIFLQAARSCCQNIVSSSRSSVHPSPWMTMFLRYISWSSPMMCLEEKKNPLHLSSSLKHNSRKERQVFVNSWVSVCLFRFTWVRLLVTDWLVEAPTKRQKGRLELWINQPDTATLHDTGHFEDTKHSPQNILEDNKTKTTETVKTKWHPENVCLCTTDSLARTQPDKKLHVIW